ncbi:TIGR02281 family clan AA aspartic protease [Chelativorans composti]|uniref:TIGR02281 family clan AA aspartic protease n=1 Tax=Chelativorans composti TaxID=768533 RepID=A0ABW5DH50_9HYPH
MRLFWIVMSVMAVGLILLIANHDEGFVFGMPDNQFASALYMSLWAAVIAVGILGSRRRMSYMFRDLAYWLLLILILMTGYQYRYELQDLGNRLTAGLIPGSPMSISKDDRISVMLDRSSNGHFEARIEVNDTLVRTLVDTGASLTVLTYEDARRAGIKVRELSFTTPVMTANGRASAARTTVRSLKLGGIERKNVPVMVAERGRLEQSLLGMQFLGSLSSFEMRGSRLILTD